MPFDRTGYCWAGHNYLPYINAALSKIAQGTDERSCPIIVTRTIRLRLRASIDQQRAEMLGLINKRKKSNGKRQSRLHFGNNPKGGQGAG
jgi:hypothetical protein